VRSPSGQLFACSIFLSKCRSLRFFFLYGCALTEGLFFLAFRCLDGPPRPICMPPRSSSTARRASVGCFVAESRRHVFCSWWPCLFLFSRCVCRDPLLFSSFRPPVAGVHGDCGTDTLIKRRLLALHRSTLPPPLGSSAEGRSLSSFFGAHFPCPRYFEST